MNGIRMQKVGGKWRFLPIAAYCTAERWPIRLAVVRVGVVGKRREQQCEARGGWMDGWMEAIIFPFHCWPRLPRHSGGRRRDIQKEIKSDNNSKHFYHLP